ncbi:hypothetical protein HU200_035892 [Digitaria exilis]|uniref:Nudix hydrolase domain-containing protein n=1 Tax=Digitaria exilis TaxID=1010633 RepID=A0A835BFG0_9POAL|nr:hypothetical protein HU200_035892 [Digitaria exilis]
MEREEGPGADMEALARRLRLHRSAPSPYESSDAVAPAPGAGELFRPRRAAVLVCLFRGAAGELRVILTKRSSSLSTHSGEQLALFVASFASHWVSVGASDGNLRMYTMGWSSTGFSSDNSELGAGSPGIGLGFPAENWSRALQEFLVLLAVFQMISPCFSLGDEDESQTHKRPLIYGFIFSIWDLSGEVALPGGKAEEGDADDAATALRESKEEIGLDPALVTIVTSLEHFLSKHLLVVVPVIGILSDIKAFKPILNAAEVDEIFDVPLEMFLKDENRTSDELEWMGQAFTIHHFNYEKGNEKYIIWGLTAAILIHASSVVYERPPDFAEKRAKFNLPKYSKECRSMPGSEPGH